MNNKNIDYSMVYRWSAPWDLYTELNNEFKFTLDPFTLESDLEDEESLLQKKWAGNENVFCCPPYGKSLYLWVEKCYLHGKRGNGIAVMLLSARTDTKWFHTYIYNQDGVEIRFLKGRLKFGNCKNYSPSPSMVVIFRK